MSPARRHLSKAHRIVVKLGTHVVTHDGVELALGRLMGLIESMARLRHSGREIVLVSSGAVGMGMRVLGLKERPRLLGLRQACAAVGQGRLMGVYSQAFAQLGTVAAQVLLTRGDLADRDRALCLRTTMMRLLELGVVPILNENDSVSVQELVEYRRRGHSEGGSVSVADDASTEGIGTGGAAPPPVEAGTGFSDNDGLSSRVAVGLDADLLVLLTNVGGLYTANPATDPTAVLIDEVAAIDDEILTRATGNSSGGTGGMISKLLAAQFAATEGVPVLIAGGGEPAVIERALDGESVGTLVTVAERRPARIRRIAVSAQHQGALVVNDGALRALVDDKASLLPIGVVAVEGHFDKGDVVEIRDGSGRVHGRGLVNYSAGACRALAGRHSNHIEAILGWRGPDALITRDNLVMGAV